MKILKAIQNLGITVENDMLSEVLAYADIDENNQRDIELILEALEPSELDYNGACHEQIDGMIDIYYYELRKWAMDNYAWIEQAIENGICDGTDFHKSIQCGQYEYYNDQFYSALSELVSEINNLQE